MAPTHSVQKKTQSYPGLYLGLDFFMEGVGDMTSNLEIMFVWRNNKLLLLTNIMLDGRNQWLV